MRVWGLDTPWWYVLIHKVVILMMWSWNFENMVPMTQDCHVQDLENNLVGFKLFHGNSWSKLDLIFGSLYLLLETFAP